MQGYKLQLLDEQHICVVGFFTVLHGMQTRSSDENSVCLSIERVDCDNTKEKSV